MFDLRYSREIVLKEISTEGYEQIRKSKVCVVGVGATGSPVADLFVRAGVGTLRIIDGDTVDISNLHRQVLYSEPDVGSYKVDAACKRLSAVNSKCNIEKFNMFINRDNAASLLKGCDIVIDGTDNMEARRTINSYCVKNRIPWVFLSSVGTVAQVKAVIPGETSCLECFTNQEENYPMSCEETGVLASAPEIVSSMAWTKALKILTGKGDSGDLIYIDAWREILEKIHINRNPNCSICAGTQKEKTND